MVAAHRIHNAPDDIRRALTARAAARGESLNAYLVDLLAREVEPDGPTIGSW